jgi:ABC-type Zn uptake system ZnuABC Zn-binding protein ZnuA
VPGLPGCAVDPAPHLGLIVMTDIPTAARPPARLSLIGSLLVFLTLLALLVAACGSSGGTDQAADPTPRIVTTTSVFADIVRNVGGDRVTVVSLVPAGAGPEDFEPRPDAARTLAEADLVVSNGVGLDDFLDKLITAAGESGVPRLVLGDGIPTITVDGEPNPHFWLDPSLVADHYLPAIAARLSEIDPAGASAYAANRDAYAAQVRAMDNANMAKIATIPAANRKLVTFHDAFPYFAAHYGFEVVGVILANVGQEPSAADLAALVQTVRAAGVKAVFSEAQFSPDLAHTLADEAGISQVVTTLYNDTVGPAPNDTYLTMMAWNVDEVAQALR